MPVVDVTDKDTTLDLGKLIDHGMAVSAMKNMKIERGCEARNCTYSFFVSFACYL